MSNIEWTEKTWQVTAGCTKVSSGCANCYAETMANRLAGMARADEAAGRDPKGKAPYLEVIAVNIARWNGQIRLLHDRLTEPLSWKKPTTVFVNSMSDLFHEAVPFEFVDKVWAVMALCPQHTFQVLTKRPERMAEYLSDLAFRMQRWYREAQEFMDLNDFPDHHGDWDWTMSTPGPLDNVWLGTSVEDQKAAQTRIPQLLRCPAAVRFLSCEPLLGPVQMPAWLKPAYDNGKFRGWDVPGVDLRVHGSSDDHFIDWVIVGGESGPNARPCSIQAVRSIVRQCEVVGVPCFVKQLGAYVLDPVVGNEKYVDWPTETLHDQEPEQGGFRMRLNDRKGGDMSEWPEDLRVREMPGGVK